MILRTRGRRHLGREWRVFNAAVILSIYVKYSATSLVHEQTIAQDNFLRHIKTGAAVFQRLHLSHKIRTRVLMYTSKYKWSEILSQKICSCGTSGLGDMYRGKLPNHDASV